MNEKFGETSASTDPHSLLLEVQRLREENVAVRDRLERMTEAVISINASLDLDIVLQRVIDSARSLTGARYGALITFDDSNEITQLLTSGITAEEIEGMSSAPKGRGLLAHLSELGTPLRLADISSHPK